MRPLTVGVGSFLLLCGIALAQTSTSFKLEEFAFNAGGTPSEGQVLTSTNFSVTLASIGDTVVASGLSSASFGMDLGFDVAYPPPGEVLGLMLTDKETLVWNAEPSAEIYNLYRDDTSDGFGNCEEQDLVAATTMDAAIPTTAFFYLVTVENRLAEEGTKGFQSNLTERGGGVDLPVCP